VAAGTPAELTRAGGVEVETARGRRVFAEARRDDVPRIVRDLVAEGEDVYGVQLLTSSLEDAYLEAVGADGSGRAAEPPRSGPSAGERPAENDPNASLWVSGDDA
jgi:hypothetical protein